MARGTSLSGAVAGCVLLAATPAARAGAVLVRRLETWGGPGLRIENPSAIAFVPESGHFFVAEARADEPSVQTRESLFELGPDADATLHALDLSPVVREPSGMAYHPQRKTLFIADDDEIELHEVALDGRPIARLDLSSLGAKDPQGVACDAQSGHVFIADGRGEQVLEITPAGSLVATLDFEDLDFENAEGIALLPSGHLLVVDGKRLRLHELTRAGARVASTDLAPLGVVRAHGLALAPSSDPSDAAATLSLYIVDDLIKKAPDGRIVEIGLVRRPRGGRTRVDLLGDVDGFGFRGDEPGFADADANHDGILEPGEQLPGGLLGRGDPVDNREPEDAPATDVLLIVSESSPLRFALALPPGGVQPLWARLTLVAGDARASSLQRSLVRADGHLLGELLGSTGESLAAGEIVATVLELSPAALADLRDGRLSVELARPAGSGDDDIMLDYARLEVAVAR